MRLFLAIIVIVMFLFSLSVFGQEKQVLADFDLVWSASTQEANTAEIVWSAESLVSGLPDSINQIKNVLAGVDLDQDGKKEIICPIVHLVNGVSRRTIQVYENDGNDSYAMVWQYTYPDTANEFVTVDQSDLDGDGNLEILSVHQATQPTSELNIFENVGDNDYGNGPVVQWDLGTPNSIEKVRVARSADLDGDGKEEVAMVQFTTNPSLMIVSVSDFNIPVWTVEFQAALGTTNPDNAAIGIGNMDNDAFPEVVCIEGRNDTLGVVEATGADAYALNEFAMPNAPSTTVSVHGIDMADLNGDGRDECMMASLVNGEVWVVATSGDVMNIDSNDVYLVSNTGEQLLEASTGSIGGKDFTIAASNAAKAINVRYLGGPGGDVTQPGNYGTFVVVDSVAVSTIVPGGVRVYGLDLAGDMDGDGMPEIVFSRGSTRGGANAPALFIMEGELTVFTGIEDQATVPSSFELSQNYPNPFNPETKIEYAVSLAGDINLSIYNVLGQKVRTLVNGYQAAQNYSVLWDGANDNGLQMPSGVYYYRLEAPEFTKTMKMLLIR